MMVDVTRSAGVYMPNVDVANDVRRMYIGRGDTQRDTVRRSPLLHLLTESLMDAGVIDVCSRRQARRLAASLIDGSTDVRALCIQYGMDPKHETPEMLWGGLPVTYLIRMDVHGECEGRCPIKIGRGRSSTARMYDMRTSSPFPLAVIADVPEWLLGEGELHAHFDYARIRGEWFRPVAELRRLGREMRALMVTASKSATFEDFHAVA